MPEWLSVEPLDVVVVDGVKVSRELFQHFADVANENNLFRLVKAGGVVTVERIKR
jgi:hypothetical protein